MLTWARRPLSRIQKIWRGPYRKQMNNERDAFLDRTMHRPKMGQSHHFFITGEILIWARRHSRHLAVWCWTNQLNELTKKIRRIGFDIASSRDKTGLDCLKVAGETRRVGTNWELFWFPARERARWEEASFPDGMLVCISGVPNHSPILRWEICLSSSVAKSTPTQSAQMKSVQTWQPCIRIL